MRPFFCRQGSKRKYSKALVSLFPAHQTYVEPFLGGGAVFWEKPPSSKEVVNDLDGTLVADYRRLLTAPSNPSLYPVLTTESAQNDFLRKSHTGKAAQVVESLLRRCNGFGGTYIKKGTSKGVYTDDRKGRIHKVTTHEDKLQTIAEYKKRLAHATLTNEGYDTILRKYDGPDTFVFLDPPYEKSVGLDYAEGSDTFPFAKFADDLKKMKGKFLVTINDSRAIRKLFKGFNLYPYLVKGHHAKSGIGKEDRKELLITNYPLHRQWKSRMTKGVLKGGAYEAEDETLTGGARGMEDSALVYNAIVKLLNDMRKEGMTDYCAIYTYAVLAAYFGDAINLRRVKRNHKPGEGVDSDLLVAILLEAGLKFLTYDHPKSDGGFVFFTDDDIDWVRNHVAEAGTVAIVFSLVNGVGHISTILPQRKTDGTDPPYIPTLFDCQTAGGRGYPLELGPTWNPAEGVEWFRVVWVDKEPVSLEDNRGKLLRKLRKLEAESAAAADAAVFAEVKTKFLALVKTHLDDWQGYIALMKLTADAVMELANTDFTKLIRGWREYLEKDMRGKGRGGATGLDVAKQTVRRLQKRKKDLLGLLASEKEMPWLIRDRTQQEDWEDELKEVSAKLKEAVALLAKFTADPVSAVPDWGTRKPTWWKRLTGRGGGKDFLPTLKRRFQLDDAQMEMLKSAETYADAIVLARGLGEEVNAPPETLAQMKDVFWGPGSCAVFALHVLEVAMKHTMDVPDAALLSLREGGLGDEQTREFLRRAGHTLTVETAKPLDALRDAMDAGEMGIVHFLDDGEGHAVAFVPDSDGDTVLVDCDEGVLPMSMASLNRLGTVDAVTVVKAADLRGEGLFARVREVLASKLGREPTELMTLQQTIQPVFAQAGVITPIPSDLRPYARVKADGGTCGIVAINNALQRNIMNLSTIPHDRVVRSCGLSSVVMDYVKDVADRNALTKDGELILNTIVERLRVFERPSSKTSGTRLSAIRTFLEWGGLTVTTAPLVPDTCGELYTMFAKDDGPFAALMSVNVGGEEHVATIRKFKDAEGETVLFWLDDLTRPGSDGQPVAWRISFSGELDRKLQWFYNDPPLIALRTLTLVTAPTVVENPLRGEGKSLNHFLTKEGIAPSTYLRDVRKKAKDAGYDPTTVEFATDGEHKVQIHTPDGRTVKFGRVGYGDYLVWSHKEGRGDVPNGTADMKRKVFRISHSAIRGKWRSDRFSPNNLALALLW